MNWPWPATASPNAAAPPWPRPRCRPSSARVASRLVAAVVRLHAAVELVAQGAIVTVAGHLHELERHRSTTNRHAVTQGHRHRELAVDDERGARGESAEADGVDAVGRVDQR